MTHVGAAKSKLKRLAAINQSFTIQTHHTAVIVVTLSPTQRKKQEMKISVLAVALLASSAAAFVPVAPSRPSWGVASTEMAAKKKKNKNKSTSPDAAAAGE